jgi:hypothetical protein
MNIIKLLPATRLSLMLLVFNQVHANQLYETPVKENQFSASISAGSLMTDNAEKTLLEPIEERQDIYGLGLVADYSNWLVDADVDYQLHAQKFSEQSQADEEYADGSSVLVFGKEADPLALELEHSRRMLLRSPEEVTLLENQQEREMISARPIIRKRLSGADRIFLQGQASKVRFIEADGSQDSKRNGATFGWAHVTSKTSAMMLSSQQMDVSFDQQPDADYRMVNTALSYQVQLRKLDYSVQVGYNEISPETGEKQSAPSYNFSLGYASGYHLFTASADRQITDSSFGNGNLGNENPIPGSDGLSQNLGKIDRRNMALDFSTDAICDRCTFSVGASLVDDEYLERDEQARNNYLRSAFVYSLSSAAKLTLRVDQSKYDQGVNQVNREYTTDYLSLEYAYRFNNGFDIRLFSRKEERDGEGEVNNYQENIYGAILEYEF